MLKWIMLDVVGRRYFDLAGAQAISSHWQILGLSATSPRPDGHIYINANNSMNSKVLLRSNLTWQNGVAMLDASHLPPGIYLLHLANKDGSRLPAQNLSMV